MVQPQQMKPIEGFGSIAVPAGGATALELAINA
jgi:hypothetical protein